MNIQKSGFCRLNVIVFLQFLFLALQGQEIHFSQIPSVPLQINPANTGTGIENFRFSNNYRNQWNSIDYPFQTLYVSLDKQFSLFGRQGGIGAFIIHDQSSGVHLTAEKFYFSLSHSFFYRNYQFIVGVQPGFVYKYYNNNRITFGSQFDPGLQTFNPYLPSNEYNIDDNMKYFDLNLGFLCRTRIKNSMSTAGISLSHVNRPYESFSSLNDSIRLNIKFSLFGSTTLPLNSRFNLQPMVLFNSINSSREFIGGTITSYSTEKQDYILQNVYLVTFFRMNPFKTIDAIILGAGTKIGGTDVCLTYDLNVSSLRKASNYRGAFEISLVFIVDKPVRKKIDEPCFML